MKQPSSIFHSAVFACFVRLTSLLTASPLYAADPPPSPRYPIDYPAADAFCVPVRAYAEDIAETVMEVNGGLTQHMPNGGYGLPVVMQEQGQNLLHLGADVAWYRAGEPVFAIANGVVRMSQGPSTAKKSKDAPRGGKQSAKQQMSWGNLVVIEHHLPDDSYITSIYGHLATKRLVKEGDLVRAGQPIGKVGRSGTENGGYKPHLHFAIRDGRRLEPNGIVFTAYDDSRMYPVRAVHLGESEIELAADGLLPERLDIGKTQSFSITLRDGKAFMPAATLYKFQNPEFAIVGYGLSTNGWRDPTEFLREKNAGQPQR